MTQPAPQQSAQPQTIEGFFSGGSKSFSWKDRPIGTTISGTIKQVHPPAQATDPVDGALVFNKKTGKPKMQVRIELQTSERDPQDPDDDGVRSLWVGGWMQGAVGDALRKAGRQGPEVGGTLTVRLIERQPNDNPALQAINKFDAHYVPAPVTGGFFDQSAPAGMAPLGQQPPAPQQQYAPPVQPQQPAGMAPLGQPAAAPAASQPLSPEQIAAYMAQAQPQAQPVPQPNIAGTGYVQPPAPAAEPEPPRPPQMNEATWATLDLAAKKQIAETFASLPPF